MIGTETSKEIFARLKQRHENLKNRYFNEKGKEQQLIERKFLLETALRQSLDQADILQKVRILLQSLSEFARKQSRLKIESLVTDCLQYIFDSSIEFKIEINEVRGRPEAEFFVLTHLDGEIIKTKPQDARGGGIIDIISLAVRVAMLQSGNLEIDGPLILDEPAKHVSDDYILQVAEFLKHLSRMFDRQIVIVTHNRHLIEVADNGFRVHMTDGISRIIFDS